MSTIWMMGLALALTPDATDAAPLAGPEVAPTAPAPPDAPPTAPPAEAPAPTPPEPSPAEPPDPGPDHPEAITTPDEPLPQPVRGGPEVRLSADLGMVTASDARWGAFTSANALGSLGLRAGLEVAQVGKVGFAPTLSWRHARAATDWSSGYDGYGAPFATEMTTDTFDLGLQVDVDLWGFFFPYVRADFSLTSGVMRVDGDRSRDDAGMWRSGAIAPGAAGTGGVEFRIPNRSGGAEVGFYVESGYAWSTDLRFAENNSLNTRGVALRTGVGVRF